MTAAARVGTHFLRRSWNETWDYPTRGLINLDTDIPGLSPFYFSVESNYDGLEILVFTRRNYWMGYIAAALYVMFVFLGPRMMANRKPLDLRRPLMYWNLFLAVFSFWGMSRVVPHLLFFIWQHGFAATFCSPPVWTYGMGACGLWTMLFIYSKYFELVDTVFIILRKKKLTFLHWYHHATVLMYTWDAFMVEQPPGLYFCAMNYTVHAIMYFYYYLAAVMKKPPSWGVFVTVLQISQMLIGVVVTVVCLYFAYSYPFLPFTTPRTAFQPLSVPGCYLSKANLWGGVAMYSTYFYLFAEFFYDRYIAKRATRFDKEAIAKKAD